MNRDLDGEEAEQLAGRFLCWCEEGGGGRGTNGFELYCEIWRV